LKLLLDFLQDRWNPRTNIIPTNKRDSASCLFYLPPIQLQRLGARGHKPIRQEGKVQPSRRLVLCLSPLFKALPL
jgi:hypothetical protein